ncbi:MAG: hypothetical protein ACK4NF_03535 [Planctomycetota bacterium]
MSKEIIMKKIYFLLVLTIIIGFILGVVFELDRKHSTPKELLDKVPAFIENLGHPTPSTVASNNNRPRHDKVSKLLIERQKKIFDIKQTLKSLSKEKDRKKKEELCNQIDALRRSIKQMEKNISIIEKDLVEKNLSTKIQQEDKKVGIKISRRCYFIKASAKLRKNIKK